MNLLELVSMCIFGGDMLVFDLSAGVDGEEADCKQRLVYSVLS
jgi:hypothetical protein